MKQKKKDGWDELKREYYKKEIIVHSEWGIIDFSLKEFENIKNIKGTSYDEYLEIMREGKSCTRSSFEQCFYNIPCSFKGRIVKIKRENVCFDRIYVSGGYFDGDVFEGKEEHVWMERKGFEGFSVGDCVSFSADVYRYLKRNPYKSIEYGLCNPCMVEKIDDYCLPTDDELVLQELSRLVCENMCLYYEQCNGIWCIATDEWRDEIVSALFFDYKVSKVSKIIDMIENEEPQAEIIKKIVKDFKYSETVAEGFYSTLKEKVNIKQ